MADWKWAISHENLQKTDVRTVSLAVAKKYLVDKYGEANLAFSKQTEKCHLVLMKNYTRNGERWIRFAEIIKL